MTRTKFMLAGLIAGAMVFGTACRADNGAERGAGARPAPPIDGVGGAGVDDPEGRWQEPGEEPIDEDGVGGAGMDDPEGRWEEPGAEPIEDDGMGGAGMDDEGRWEEPGERPEDTGGAGDEGLREDEREMDDFGREPGDDVGGAGFEEPGRDVEGEPLGEEDFGDEPPTPRG